MTALLIFLKTFFSGLIPVGVAAATGFMTNPLKALKSILILVIVAGVLGGGFYIWKSNKKDQDTAHDTVVGVLTNAIDKEKEGAKKEREGSKVDLGVVTDNTKTKTDIVQKHETLDEKRERDIQETKKKFKQAKKTNGTKVAKKPVDGTKSPEATSVSGTGDKTLSDAVSRIQINYLWAVYCEASSQTENGSNSQCKNGKV